MSTIRHIAWGVAALASISQPLLLWQAIPIVAAALDRVVRVVRSHGGNYVPEVPGTSGTQ